MPLTQEELQAIVKQVTDATAKRDDALASQIKSIVDQQAEIVKNQGILADTFKAIPPTTQSKDDKGGKAGGEALTAEAVAKLVTETVAKTLGAHQQQSDAAAKRAAFVGEKMKDLPDAYKNLLGTDPAKWATEEQDIRKQFRDVLKANGAKVEEISTAAPAGGAPAAAVIDRSKLSPTQLIEVGLKQDAAGAASK